MTEVHETNGHRKGAPHETRSRLESAIAAWKASVADANTGLTRRLQQTNELIDCLVRAIADRDVRLRGAASGAEDAQGLLAALSDRERQIEALTAELAGARERVAAAQALVPAIDGARNELGRRAERIAALEAELASAREAESAAQTALQGRDGQLQSLEAALAASRDRESVAQAALGDLASAQAQSETQEAALAQLRSELASARDLLQSANDALGVERRRCDAAVEQQAQWKNELAKELASQSRQRQALEDECEELRAEVATLHRANESLSREVGSRRPGGTGTTLPFRLIDDTGNKRRLGEMLVDAGYLTPTDLDEALVEQESMRETRLGTILINRGLVRQDVVAEGLALQNAG